MPMMHFNGWEEMKLQSFDSRAFVDDKSFD